jgi:glycine/D-amino acid oxidase-like deaminating enzyme/nitrite reductase/ring-hydroxylating ferredoxin subunit
MNSSETTVSLWKGTTQPLHFPALLDDTTADVCVIGAGIAGLTTARLLAAEGRSVVVLDRAAVGGGESGQTSAHLVSEIDDFYHEIESMHGREGARIALNSHQTAIERIGALVAEDGISCEYERVEGYLFLDPEAKSHLLDKELEAARRAGFVDAEPLPRIPLDFWDSGPCLRFPRQGQIHPLRYLHGLAHAAIQAGVRIFTNTEVSESPGGGPTTRVVTRSGYSVSAAATVVATNYPITRWLGIVPKVASYRTFVIGAEIPRGSIPHMLMWDTGDPYHYIRVAPGQSSDQEILLVGGEDHKTGQEDDGDQRFAKLESWTAQRFPMAGQILYRWSGQVQEPADAVAFIGAHPGEENLYVITGDSGQGLTHGTLGAILVTDLIMGRPNAWSGLYDPMRSGLAAPVEFAKENLNTASQYRDLLLRDEAESPDQVAPGTGAVIRQGLKPVAVYRDEAGAVHQRSALCTHLECVVRWNSTEKSWDCPCHGSRYSPTGEVLTGPAIQGLKAV